MNNQWAEEFIRTFQFQYFLIIHQQEIKIIFPEMNLSDMIMSMTGKTDSKLGYTTTVKDQVDEIENKIQHFKKTLETQKKQQSELQFQIKKLQESTKTSYTELQKQITQKVSYLSELFKTDTRNQNKQFDYLELQNTTLSTQHEKLNELTCAVSSRTQEVENCVGI